MHDKGVLHEIYHAVDEPRETADACAIPIGEEEQRHHRPERHAAALRHVEYAQLMEHDRQCQHEGDIDEHACREMDAAHLQIAEDEDEYCEQREKTGWLCQQLCCVLDECIHENLLGLGIVCLQFSIAYYKCAACSIPSATSVSVS